MEILRNPCLETNEWMTISDLLQEINPKTQIDSNLFTNLSEQVITVEFFQKLQIEKLQERVQDVLIKAQK